MFKFNGIGVLYTLWMYIGDWLVNSLVPMYNILFIESGEKLIQQLDNQTHAFQTVIVIIGFFSRIFFYGKQL